MYEPCYGEKWKEIFQVLRVRRLFDRPKPTAGSSANGRRRGRIML